MKMLTLIVTNNKNHYVKHTRMTVSTSWHMSNECCWLVWNARTKRKKKKNIKKWKLRIKQQQKNLILNVKKYDTS